LPVLPAGWIYEAWHSLLFAETVSLGTFPSPSGPDADGAGPRAGPLPGYPYPGQDYPWDPIVDLQDGTVSVSVEPDDRRDGEGPFLLLQILGAAMPLPGDTVRSLVNVARLPTASVTVPFTP
ncbi:hypothetical protein K8I85_08940, partial [bacterium]|nr:hypothetical protein [bacterium]